MITTMDTEPVKFDKNTVIVDVRGPLITVMKGYLVIGRCHTRRDALDMANVVDWTMRHIKHLKDINNEV